MFFIFLPLTYNYLVINEIRKFVSERENMKNIKKLFLGMASIATVVAPITAVVSCGSEKAKNVAQKQVAKKEESPKGESTNNGWVVSEGTPTTTPAQELLKDNTRPADISTTVAALKVQMNTLVTSLNENKDLNKELFNNAMKTKDLIMKALDNANIYDQRDELTGLVDMLTTVNGEFTRLKEEAAAAVPVLTRDSMVANLKKAFEKKLVELKTIFTKYKPGIVVSWLDLEYTGKTYSSGVHKDGILDYIDQLEEDMSNMDEWKSDLLAKMHELNEGHKMPLYRQMYNIPTSVTDTELLWPTNIDELMQEQ